MIVFTKFYEDRTKIVDFLPMEVFERVSLFYQDSNMSFFYLKHALEIFCIVVRLALSLERNCCSKML